MFGPKEKGGLAVGVSLFVDFLCFIPNLLIYQWILVYLIAHFFILMILLRIDLFYRAWSKVRFSFIFAVVPLCFAGVFAVGSAFSSEGIRTDLWSMSGGAAVIFLAVFSLNWWKYSKWTLKADKV